eukprot:TRINITY_DN19935_c0_g2_i1.p1 TRINITY_DN19935_c0_g2~~TRINITY_DN19935_c0_g2_i1.p1  ORF type:complete len:690 (-),score=123.08 TRINITY_DN19935_c0_g2_i1:36-2105(-)
MAWQDKLGSTRDPGCLGHTEEGSYSTHSDDRAGHYSGGQLERIVQNMIAREKNQIEMLVEDFEEGQRKQLSKQLRIFQEALARNHQACFDAILTNVRLPLPTVKIEQQQPACGEVDAVMSEEIHVRASASTPSRRQHQARQLPVLLPNLSDQEEQLGTMKSDLRRPKLANLYPARSAEVEDEALPVAPLRSLSEDESTGGPIWAPSKEATRDAFNKLLENVQGSSLGLDRFFRRALRRSGLDMDQLSAPKTRSSCLLRLVNSPIFVGSIMLLIALNCAFICFLADHDVRCASEQYASQVSGSSTAKANISCASSWQTWVDISFAAIFSLELLLRMFAEECLFWIGPEWKWNIFDFVMVLSMVADAVLVLAGLDISYIRLLRIVRALRSIRIIRVLRFFRELRVMLLSIMNSIAPLLWAVLFLFLIISVFSVVFLQGVTGFLEDHDRASSSSALVIQDIEEFYSSFPMTFFSLFMAITGGDDWWNFVKPLLDISPAYGIVFVLYISLMVLGTLNIITGIFVESATELSRMDRDLVTQSEQERTSAYMKELQRIFFELDTNRSGTISLEEFEEFVKKDAIRAHFSVLELDVSKAAQVFRLLDTDGSNEIQIDEFVVGCMRLKGLAKGIDMESLMLDSKKMLTRWSNHQKWARRQFSRVEETMEINYRSLHSAIEQLSLAMDKESPLCDRSL